MLRDARERWTVGASLLVLALPWGYLAWASRPGAGRALVEDVVTAFLLPGFVVIQWSVERTVRTRRPGPVAIGFAMVIANAALLALRLRDLSILPTLSAAMLAMGLIVLGGDLLVHRLLGRSRRTSP